MRRNHVDTSPYNQNLNQGKKFGTSRSVLDGVDAQYIAQFEAPATEDLKTKLARQGFTALLDTLHIRVLYWYDEIEQIIANRTSDPKGISVFGTKEYNWPAIQLISMVYDTKTCTTMVELTGGENPSEQRRQVWKWEHRGGKWISLTFSEYFVPGDVEISKQGISFILSPKRDTKLTKLYVLKK
jgi:hypothetical protein